MSFPTLIIDLQRYNSVDVSQWKKWGVLPIQPYFENITQSSDSTPVEWVSCFPLRKARPLIHLLFPNKYAQILVINETEFEKLHGGVQDSEIAEEWLQELSAHRSEIENTEQGDSAGAVIRLAKNLIDQAVKEKATDLHFEPEESKMKIRLRKDGLLVPIQDLPEWVMPALTSRLKIMGNLDISEKRLPQDGRITWQDNSGDIDIRLSTLPTRFGEKLVLRLLRSNVRLDGIEDLGLPPTLAQKIKRCFSQPQGVLYVTGPTGSGKSSTLYAGLRSLSHPGINITTIEDPIEYHLEGANQVQINDKAGLTFAKTLRSILRQDPDVILVGETRDLETAQISIQAAQTGHLVLSTLHTNDSLSAVNRLRDLGVAPYLISSSLLGVIAQRLVRKVCPHCSTEMHNAEEAKEMFPDLNDFSKHAIGCEECNHTGYIGRLAIFEFLEINSTVREAIHSKADLNGLKDKVENEKVWWSLKADGTAKVNQGLTTVQELIRVLGV